MTSEAVKILISSAGRRVALINCFRRAAKEVGISLTVIACDLDPGMSPACRSADASYAVPACDDPDFVWALQEIALREKIDLIVPTIDPELPALARAMDDFEAIGCRVHVSQPAVIDIVRDKLETMNVLGAAGIPVPRTIALEEFASTSEWSWPVFVKPRSGSASRAISVAGSRDELPSKISEPMIVQENLTGTEYTVNGFVDARGRLQTAITHRRVRVRAGEVEKGITERQARHSRIAHDIVGALPGLRGAFCFQMMDDGVAGPKVIEINARFGGGYPLADHAGAQFAKWLLEEVSGSPASCHDNWRSGVLMLRYDEAIFVDGEDE
ncbi:carbamoyl phosphate synthetase-like protein (plasmid) [Rhizobium etli 8C-3]|uniref:Carbamoyl-phosphate synthase large subunit n=2 Tax=Rhizobium TaxID=379 RepID=A0A4R3R742_9HYPH|nr:MULTISPECIES: ATP-grasp domain-containing protein [Rhizobium]APO78939.1 carbamoyl phosphate synthetase-like protein [Rhizobium etli 8C-3]TCU28912.1 carbamoyl-phosphate synthase large subunit [Rhizobium azibense]TCU33829.1 carbamoyl-phosphate synthase large subunit [Rhizobium azibense]